MKIDPARVINQTAQVLAAAANVLVPLRARNAYTWFRPRQLAAHARVRIDTLIQLEALGLIEIGPRQRWARLTPQGEAIRRAQS